MDVRFSLEGTNTTVDLPATGAPPATVAEIDLSSKKDVVCIRGYIAVAGWWAFAADTTALKTALSSAARTSAHQLTAGAYFQIDVARHDSTQAKLGFVSDGAAATNGLSYHLLRE